MFVFIYIFKYVYRNAARGNAMEYDSAGLIPVNR